MSDYPMLISNKLHSFRNFWLQIDEIFFIKQRKRWYFLCQDAISLPLGAL